MAKAQSMSINVIIVAILALIVLVILAVIFVNRINDTNTNSKSCELLGGRCTVTGCGSGEHEYGPWVCQKSATGASQVCCVAGA